MTVPLVSVKMITYNHAPFIAQAIEGVLQQKTNFPFELIIGEDCSTDGTREIVFEYQKKYPDIIRVITSDKNVGAKKNGIRTMKAVSGESTLPFARAMIIGRVHTNCKNRRIISRATRTAGWYFPIMISIISEKRKQ